MALYRRSVASVLSFVSAGNSAKINRSLVKILAVPKQNEDGRRHLFSSEILGLENYARQKSSLTEKAGFLREKFFSRMEDYMKTSDNNTIFTDDLKTMVYFAETEPELETGLKMLKRFHLQNKDLRFSNFVFGPLIMRLLHIMKKPDLAFELFTDENLKGMFDQMSSFVVVMDLLYESRQFERVLETMEIVKKCQLNGIKYPMDCVTLSLASCYELNTKESLETAMALMKETKGVTASISMRSAIYAAMLALKQGKPEIASEMLSASSVRPGRYLPVAYVNVKLLILSGLGRAEEAVDQLKSIVHHDSPDHIARNGEVFEEVLEQVRSVVAKSSSKELKHQLEITEKALRGGNHIATGQILKDYLQRPIIRQRKIQDGYKQRDRAPVGGFQRTPGKSSYRPGLLE